MPSKLELTAQFIRATYSNGEDFRFDLLSRKVQVHLSPLPYEGKGSGDRVPWRNLTDKDINTIACRCAQATGASITDREVRIALGSDLVRDVHPLRDWIRQLPPYQPESGDWIDLVSQQVHIAPSPDDTASNEQLLWSIYFKKWFVAIVASWMDDAVVNHQVLVLIGRQGTGKTTWLEHLLPLNKFGQLLRGAGYRQRVLHGGKRGYVVQVTENLTDKQHEDIHELLTGADGATIF